MAEFYFENFRTVKMTIDGFIDGKPIRPKVFENIVFLPLKSCADYLYFSITEQKFEKVRFNIRYNLFIALSESRRGSTLICKPFHDSVVLRIDVEIINYCK